MEVLKAQETLPCAQCEKPAHWIDNSFIAYFCSPACLDKLWKEFWDAQDSRRPSSSLTGTLHSLIVEMEKATDALSKTLGELDSLLKQAQALR
jgi:hypothetical protein